MDKEDKANLKLLKGTSMRQKAREKLTKPNLLGDVCINREEWNKWGLENGLANISQWSIPYGLLIECNFRRILESMSEIQFVNIKKLSLRYNNIESIEPICRLRIPSLQKLFLSHNWVFNMNSLRRADFPNLQHLQIDRNFVREVYKLSEMNFRSLTTLNTDRPDRYASIEWVFKISVGLKRIQISSYKRIEQQEHMRQLDKKFLNVKAIKNWN